LGRIILSSPLFEEDDSYTGIILRVNICAFIKRANFRFDDKKESIDGKPNEVRCSDNPKDTEKKKGDVEIDGDNGEDMGMKLIGKRQAPKASSERNFLTKSSLIKKTSLFAFSKKFLSEDPRAARPAVCRISQSSPYLHPSPYPLFVFSL